MKPDSLILLTLIFLVSLSSTPAEVAGNPGQVTVLVSGQGAPHGVAIADGYVYWADYWAASDRGTVNRIPLQGGNATVLVAERGQPENVAVDDGFVYWTDYEAGFVGRVEVTGGTPEIIATQQDRPWSILVHDGFVYWSELLVGNIRRAPVGGGPVEYVVQGRAGIPSFVIEGNNIYWAEGFIQGSSESQIGTVALNGGSPRKFVNSLKPWSLVIESGYLYWTEYRMGLVKKVSLEGGPVQLIQSEGIFFDQYDIAADSQSVYWTEPRGNIESIPLAGGPVLTLATNRTGRPYGIASDGVHLVWTEDLGGNVVLYTLHEESSWNQPIYLALEGAALALIGIAIVLRKFRPSKRKH